MFVLNYEILTEHKINLTAEKVFIFYMALLSLSCNGLAVKSAGSIERCG